MGGKIALVTGGSRGVGRGVAQALHAAGNRVYATGRHIAAADLPQGVTRLACDHADDRQVSTVFDRIRDDHGRLDILVNCAWAGYESLWADESAWKDGRLVMERPFWLQKISHWDAMMNVGARSAFVAAQLAVPLMLAGGEGLIVNISFWSSQKYLGDVIYGCAMAAIDKMTRDMAHELQERNICVLSLYPGLVRTERVLELYSREALPPSESPEFIGLAVEALANDPDRMHRTGQAMTSAQVALDHGYRDIDGLQPPALTLADIDKH